MLKKHPFLAGTFILTVTGLISRVIGFFYRVFLSKNIGEEGMGIYQLLAPIMVLSFSLTAGSIQTAISKYVASEPTTKNYKSSRNYLITGTLISVSLSIALSMFLFHYAPWFANNILLEGRCAPLVRIFSLSIPFASIHACINGYYYGIKNATIPAVTQLIEQTLRVLSVYWICAYCTKLGIPISISISIVGILIGELGAITVSIIAILLRFHHLHAPLQFCSSCIQRKCTTDIIRLAIPLTGNRIVLNLLQSVEAIYIPNRLMAYGLSNERVLSIYGVLTGMSLPLILFPTALTGSISVLLLPYISEAQETNNHDKVSTAIKRCLSAGLSLGFCCTVFFFIFGKLLGQIMFNSEMAGIFIKSMSFICPFLYLASILSSIILGLGKAGTSFIYNTISLLVRLFFVFFAIPTFGIQGYLIGLLISEILLCFLYFISLRKYILHK